MTQPGLRRELGKWDFSAIGVNQVIGGAVFLMPAIVAAQIGAWSWIAVALSGALAMLIALNFAEASSRFDGTGGPYLYTREAFGRFTGFEVGWMSWVTRVTSWASVLNGLTAALGFYWPALRTGMPRVALMCAVVLALTVINLRGIRQSALTINLITVGKLLPLALFIVVGLPHVRLAALTPGEAVTWTQISTAALYLIFTYGGYETVPVLAGEGREPRRMIPFAMVTTILIVATVFTLVQVVALSTLSNLGAATTPLADAALVFIGGWGALAMTAGAAVSMTGNNMGGALTGSRLLFALAERGDVPPFFGRINARFQTPHIAILVTSAATLGLALSSSFATMAQSSSVARLLVYAGTCASVLALRRQGRALFTIPGGPIVPVVALAVSGVILYNVTAAQWRVGGAALIIGAVLFGVTQSLAPARRQEATS